MGSSPRSIRFETAVGDRLASYVAKHPGGSQSSVANRLVDEGLRMDEHPGVVFRDGPTGRRAGLVGGSDVREVIRAVRSARGAERKLGATKITALVAKNTGLSERLVETAVRYWSAYPHEIDAWINEVEGEETAALEAWQRRQSLLSS